MSSDACTVPIDISSNGSDSSSHGRRAKGEVGGDEHIRQRQRNHTARPHRVNPFVASIPLLQLVGTERSDGVLGGVVRLEATSGVRGGDTGKALAVLNEHQGSTDCEAQQQWRDRGSILSKQQLVALCVCIIIISDGSDDG